MARHAMPWGEMLVEALGVIAGGAGAQFWMDRAKQGNQPALLASGLTFGAGLGMLALGIYGEQDWAFDLGRGFVMSALTTGAQLGMAQVDTMTGIGDPPISDIGFEEPLPAETPTPATESAAPIAVGYSGF